MIDCGQIKVTLSAEGSTHVRLTVTQDQPPGHLPKKLVDLAINRDELSAELAGAKL